MELPTRLLSILLTNELTRESVRVEILPGGHAGVTGRGDVLNWFAEQVPHFNGLLERLMREAPVLYVPVGDAQNNESTGRLLFRAGSPATTDYAGNRQ